MSFDGPTADLVSILARLPNDLVSVGDDDLDVDGSGTLFANRHHLRRRIALSVVDAPAIPTQLPLFDLQGRAAVVGVEHGGVSRPRRIAWARLSARVFSVDILACPRCEGRLVATAALLHGARGPPRPSPPGQLQLLA